MTLNEQINREENLSREDVLVGSELTGRINCARRELRNGQAPSHQELHDMLGDCALLLSDLMWENRENQARKLIVNRLMSQLSFAEVTVSPATGLPVASIPVAAGLAAVAA